MSRIYVPAKAPDDWAHLLAEPVKHWRTGYSARTLAHSWHEASGFPAEVTLALSTSPSLAGAELLLAIPEHQVPLPGGGRPSQNDIWALASVGGRLASLAIEGKVAEPFGPTVGEWQEQSSRGKATRLAFLQSQLGLNGNLATTVRYQLLHRTVSAIIEARRFAATHAVMLVHSFSQSHQWFEDFAAFAQLLDIEPERGTVQSAGTRGGVELHLGWVCGNPEYLDK